MMRNENINLPHISQSCKTRVISSFFKKLFYIRFYKFDNVKWGSPKSANKYYLTIKFFNKYFLDFRIMNQDNSFFFRCEQLNYYLNKNNDINLKF